MTSAWISPEQFAALVDREVREEFLRSIGAQPPATPVQPWHERDRKKGTGSVADGTVSTVHMSADGRLFIDGEDRGLAVRHRDRSRRHHQSRTDDNPGSKT